MKHFHVAFRSDCLSSFTRRVFECCLLLPLSLFPRDLEYSMDQVFEFDSVELCTDYTIDKIENRKLL